MQNFWDERYTEQKDVYGTKPNVFFKQELDKIPTGKLLLPGEGEGRNAIYAAQQGWDVTAFDSSKVAIENATQKSAALGVIFNYQLADSNDFVAYKESFDAIALVFFHLPPPDRVSFHKKVIEWLRPGGTLIIEAFNPNQLGNPSGGPKNIDMLYTKEMLEKDFAALTQLNIETLTEFLDEGAFHKGAAELIRFVGKKK